jgi:hypothetical protein
MMAMTVLVMVLGGIMAGLHFALRMAEISNAKGSANAESRRYLSTLMSEVGSAKMVAVGDGGLSAFIEAGMDAAQEGSALQLYPTTDTNVFIRYYLDSVDQKLKRMTNGAASAAVVASGISNGEVFTLEDFSGNVLSNNQNNCAVGLVLRFSQVQSAEVPVGPSRFYTSYEVRTKIARRAL